jgi:hypothetical protein
MPITIDGTNGITQAGEFNSDSSFGFKNRIINGAMVIDQRNAGASVTATTDYRYSLDRWDYRLTQGSKFTVQQNAGSVTPPVGFTNYLGITSSSAYSVVASDFFDIEQRIEGFNVSDFGFGTANAKTVTLSFWVRSSLTGTFGGAIKNGNSDRSYPFSYTISSANTWEQKSVTIAGDTSGTWATNSDIGLIVQFSLGAGSTYSGTVNTWAGANYYQPTGATSVVGTNGATFYITGVQLEVGSTATSFDYRPYTTELQLCQRYYWKTTGTSGNGYVAVGAGGYQSSTNFIAQLTYPVQMRSSPTISIGTSLFINTASFPSVTAIGTNYSNQFAGRLDITTASSTAGFGGSLGLNNNTASFIDASAEL